MHFLGVAVLITAGIFWIVGGKTIMRPNLRRPGGQSLISRLRLSPISLKDFTPNQKRHLIWLTLTTIVLVFLGLGLTQGAFD
jgi:hypothetical protein